ncbi:MAG: carboxypeptidase-like regulatory domain-containing protein [Nitrospira sp.]|nr:carboxypeptidase-like regulatory domain-containing protein [Nitrospira sp.]
MRSRCFRLGAVVLAGFALTIGCLSMISSSSVFAAEFGMVEIVVHDPNGTRISNADLCLAMPGQNARKMTDSNGSYKTTLPIGSTTIRVYKSGYANAQETVTMTNGANLVRFIQLQPGQATPLPSDCGSITATTTPGNSCDVLTKFQVDGPTTTTNRQLAVLLEFSSPPESYRITEFSAAERYPESQFKSDVAFSKKNVPWVRHGLGGTSLTTFFTLTEPHYGTHSIYIQTRRYQSGCISSPRVASVILAPASLQTHVLTGEALNRFVAEAKRRGYQFSHRFTFKKKDGFWKMCGPNEMLEPKYPRLGQRQLSPAVEMVDERIEADFEIFSGPDLNPFWEFQYARALHPDLPAVGDGGGVVGDGNIPGKPALSFEKFSDIGCPYCTAQGLKNLHRRLEWTRLMWRTPVPSSPLDDQSLTVCKRRSQGEPWLIQLKIRGPAGEDPINALGDLRVITPQDLRLAPPPRIILPRGVEGEGGGEDNQTVDVPVEPEKKP